MRIALAVATPERNYIMRRAVCVSSRQRNLRHRHGTSLSRVFFNADFRRYWFFFTIIAVNVSHEAADDIFVLALHLGREMSRFPHLIMVQIRVSRILIFIFDCKFYEKEYYSK